MSIDCPRLRDAIRSVACACRVTRPVQRDLDRVRQITKDDSSPVTVADFAAQAVVSLELGPEAVIVGEEHAGDLRGDEHAAVRDAVVEAVRTYRPDVSIDEVLDAIDRCDHDGSADAFWALDPVDGTKGFLRGEQYAIALAYLEQGEVIGAVMGCPNLPDVVTGGEPVGADSRGLIYAAGRGQGAWELSPTDPQAPPRPVGVAVHEPREGVRVCESVEAAHSRQSDTRRILEHLGERSAPVRLDSQCKYALVARGHADAYLRMPSRRGYVEKIWDHAAGMLIAVEAGAVVTDVGGAGLDFRHGTRLEQNRGIVCAVRGLHERIIRAIEDLGIGDR